MEFNTTKYKVYTWKHFTMLHWILNPGLAFNELVLGQRVPKVTLEDRTSDKPRYERTYVPCPHCKTLHDGRTWSLQTGTAFKNWFGLYCPTCSHIIPCLTNATSFLVLALTFPLWGWFRMPLEGRWLEAQPKRYKNLQPEAVANPFDNRKWIVNGLIWGLVMFIVMNFLFPFFTHDLITWKGVLTSLPIWAIGGLGFGFMVKLINGKKGRESAAAE